MRIIALLVSAFLYAAPAHNLTENDRQTLRFQERMNQIFEVCRAMMRDDLSLLAEAVRDAESLRVSSPHARQLLKIKADRARKTADLLVLMWTARAQLVLVTALAIHQQEPGVNVTQLLSRARCERRDIDRPVLRTPSPLKPEDTKARSMDASSGPTLSEELKGLRQK